MREPIEIEVGTELTIDVLTWHEPAWEFDHPSVVLRPVIAFSPNGALAAVAALRAAACEEITP